jgi:putative ABC transport system permease protein
METWIHDIRFALRTLRRSPGVVAAAIVSLALGIGANVTIFSAADVFLFRPLPYEESDLLLHVFNTVPDRGWTNNVNSIPDFLDFRKESRTMDVASMRGRDYNLSGRDRPERIEGVRISWNFFRVLRVRPALGRTFSSEEEQDGQHRVAILSDGLWRRRFGAETSIIGQTILLDGESFTVVGVLPPKFWYGNRTTEIWTPFRITGEEDRGSHFLHSFARLEPDATVEQAHAEIEAIAYRLEEAYPESNEGWSAGVKSLHDEVFPIEFKMGSLISSVAVAFVLLIACFNVANLMLTRVAERGREIALRGALGAARGRIVRQFLTEAMIVSFLGGVAGIALSVAGIRGFVSIMPAFFPRADEIGLDGRVLLFYSVWTMEEVMRESMGGNTIMAKIMSVLGGIALVLSIVGVYGVMAYSISQRTQEMGIRMALGARRMDVLAMIVRQGAKLAVIGVTVGLLIAAGVAQSLSIFLFGVSPYDPPVFVGVTVTLLLSGLLATYLPARRATRVDPVEALRYE